MKIKNDSETIHYLRITAKSLAYLCINSSTLKDKDKGDKAEFLEELGLTRQEIADLLHTSLNSLRVLLHHVKKAKKVSKK
jgi:hypothetical protein